MYLECWPHEQRQNARYILLYSIRLGQGSFRTHHFNSKVYFSSLNVLKIGKILLDRYRTHPAYGAGPSPNPSFYVSTGRATVAAEGSSAAASPVVRQLADTVDTRQSSIACSLCHPWQPE